MHRADTLVSLQPADADERPGAALAGKPLGFCVDGKLRLAVLQPGIRVMLVTPAAWLALPMPVAGAAGNATAVNSQRFITQRR